MAEQRAAEQINAHSISAEYKDQRQDLTETMQPSLAQSNQD